jgi:hypothetical protein
MHSCGRRRRPVRISSPAAAALWMRRLRCLLINRQRGMATYPPKTQGIIITLRLLSLCHPTPFPKEPRYVFPLSTLLSIFRPFVRRKRRIVMNSASFRKTRNDRQAVTLPLYSPPPPPPPRPSSPSSSRSSQSLTYSGNVKCVRAREL